MVNPNVSGEVAHKHGTLVLTVRYITAIKRYVDEKARQEETLSALKPSVLKFFELTEGNVDGGTKSYFFSMGGDVLTDLSVTLGSLAHGKHELKLDLIERFEQG